MDTNERGKKIKIEESNAEKISAELLAWKKRMGKQGK